MLIPLVGLLLACAVFAGVGVAVLAFIPKLHPTLVNVSVFVVGAVPSSAVSSIAYGRIFGNGAGELNSVAVIGLFVVLLISGLCGGYLSVLAYERIIEVIRPDRGPGSPASR